MKTSELTGTALDWAVAKCEGRHELNTLWVHDDVYGNHVECPYSPSTDWAQGGPIIDREKISIRQWTNVPIIHAYMPTDERWSEGESSLIAAMRCFCRAKLGDEIDTPSELAS